MSVHEIKNIIQTAKIENENFDSAVKRLAALSSIEYERARQKEADSLGVRVSFLDSRVMPSNQGSPKSGIVLTDIIPWHETKN